MSYNFTVYFYCASFTEFFCAALLWSSMTGVHLMQHTIIFSLFYWALIKRSGCEIKTKASELPRHMIQNYNNTDTCSILRIDRSTQTHTYTHRLCQTHTTPRLLAQHGSAFLVSSYRIFLLLPVSSFLCGFQLCCLCVKHWTKESQTRLEKIASKWFQTVWAAVTQKTNLTCFLPDQVGKWNIEKDMGSTCDTSNGS